MNRLYIYRESRGWKGNWWVRDRLYKELEFDERTIVRLKETVANANHVRSCINGIQKCQGVIEFLLKRERERNMCEWK